MLRPVGQESLEQLRAAALMTDVALDLALMRIGVLAPADLSEIRAELLRPGVAMRATKNPDGHCIVQFVEHDVVVSALHHDGRLVTHLTAAA